MLTQKEVCFPKQTAKGGYGRNKILLYLSQNYVTIILPNPKNVLDQIQ